MIWVRNFNYDYIKLKDVTLNDMVLSIKKLLYAVRYFYFIFRRQLTFMFHLFIHCFLLAFAICCYLIKYRIVMFTGSGHQKYSICF